MTYPEFFSLAGRNVLVTGASSGIGRACARLCGQAGATVILTGRDTARLETAASAMQADRCRIFAADLTEETGVAGLVDSLEPIDGLVMCAGINDVFPVRFAARKKVTPIFETNFFSQVELLRLLVKKKKLSACASVVAISSIGGNDTFSIGQAAYGASKAALLSWMKYAAKELAPNGIRVNCILPGHVDTPMNEGLAFTAEQLDAYRETIPLKRFGTPDDVACGAVFLLSDASSWMTGSQLKIDGGATL